MNPAVVQKAVRATPAPAASGTCITGAAPGAATPRCTVVKLGGRSLETPDAFRELAGDLAGASGALLLVHGGGADVTAWCARLGIAARFDEGLRVTDAATLEVAAAVLAGLANKRIVAALRDAGVDAMGLSALDGGIVEAWPHADTARLGHVGEVARVDTARLGGWMTAGLVPVVASIGAHEGRLLNLNADDVAASIAAALGATSLVLLSDTPGVRLGGAVRAHLPAEEIESVLAGGDVAGGMRAKLRAARSAAAAGVGRVHVTAWQGPGTLTGLIASAGEAR